MVRWRKVHIEKSFQCQLTVSLWLIVALLARTKQKESAKVFAEEEEAGLFLHFVAFVIVFKNNTEMQCIHAALENTYNILLCYRFID